MPTPQLLTSALISILSLNVWGLPDAAFRVLSPFRAERIAAICDEFRKASARPDGWDVILLQEVWVEQDRRTLKNCGYAYSVDLESSSRPLDSGLMILSRYPLEDAKRLTYPSSNDNSRSFTDGEALAQKSAISARVVHPGGNFRVANTHLVSFYEGEDIYQERRRQQFIDFTDWTRQLVQDGINAGRETGQAFMGGDFNFDMNSPLWPEVEKRLPGFTQAGDFKTACTICPPNVMHTRNEGRVDFVLASPGWTPVSGEPALAAPITIDSVEINVSDHFGWQSRFARETAPLP